MQYLDKNGVTKLWSAIKQKFETRDSATQTKERITSAEGTVNQLSNSVRSVQMAVTELKNKKQSKLYIAYSKSSDGTGMTLTPQADSSYIGFCASTDDNAPMTPNSYKWALFKGQGGGGASAYTWIAYASDDMGTDFSHTYNKDTHHWVGLGLNKLSLTASNNHADYEWYRIVDSRTKAKVNQLETDIEAIGTIVQSIKTDTQSKLAEIHEQTENLSNRLDWLKSRIDGVKDYIVSREKITKDGISWTVVKYDSGDMHAWGNGQVTFPGGYTNMTPNWWRKVIFVNLPVTFNKLTSVIAQGSHDGGILATNDFIEASNVSKFELHYYSSKNQTLQESWYAHFEVRGRWK